MIEYIEGNIFDSPMQVIVNTVNTVGVMGKGLALEFKKRYPAMFVVYKRACEKHSFKVGKLMTYTAPDHIILLFPTKENWRYPSKLSYIETGLKHFCENYAQRGITSIAFPKLGCGNGELDWNEVRPLMERYLKGLPIDICIYTNVVSHDSPEHKHQKEMSEWLRQNAKDMSFNAVSDDIRHQCVLIPYEFVCEGVKCIAQYIDDDLHIQYGEQEMIIDEDTFFTIWDIMRNKMIFTLEEADNIFIVLCYLLYSLGYMSQIKKQNKKGQMVDGFQMNEWLGRAYALNKEN